MYFLLIHVAYFLLGVITVSFMPGLGLFWLLHVVFSSFKTLLSAVALYLVVETVGRTGTGSQKKSFLVLNRVAK